MPSTVVRFEILQGMLSSGDYQVFLLAMNRVSNFSGLKAASFPVRFGTRVAMIRSRFPAWACLALMEGRH